VTINPDHSAFPNQFSSGEGELFEPNPGLSIRAYLAAKAMHGFLSYPLEASPGHTMEEVRGFICANAVAYADSLIEALNRPHPRTTP
jgi:hypothetical protein